MLIVSTPSLSGLIQDIASRAREVTDHNGDQVVLPTINDRQLRAAALVALSIATGEIIWPADQKIDVRRKKATGLVSIVEE